MVTAIHAMAAALGKVTVAEGVETAEQLAALREIGCHRIQGFLTGRPAPFAHLITPPADSVGPPVATLPPSLN